MVATGGAGGYTSGTCNESRAAVPPMSEVTRILSAIEQGDPHAAAQLLPLVYDEPRQLAAQKLAQEAPGQTLQATALVHEAYLRLVDTDQAQAWNSRGHFFAACAEAMRRILIDHVRRKRSQRQGGTRRRCALAEEDRVDLPQAQCHRSASRRTRETAGLRRNDHRRSGRSTGRFPADREAQLGLRPGVAGPRAGRLRRAQPLTDWPRPLGRLFLARFLRRLRTVFCSSARQASLL